jgi:peptide/nickel transport system substrate-binding protein
MGMTRTPDLRPILAFVTAAALILGACAPAPAQPGAQASPGAPAAASPAAKAVPLMKIGTTQDESSWNPYTYNSGYPGWTVLLMQFDTLMAFDLNNVPQPWLAKDVQASADSKTWTLTLASGVKWHDGKDFTADDVKFTIEYFQKNIHGRFSTPLRDVEKIDVTGADKVVITVKAPKPGWRAQALGDVPMLPKHIWSTYEGDPKKATDLKFSIGTGPYQLVEYKADQLYRFKANPNYFKGKPLVDEIVMPIIKEANTAFAAVKTGDLDATVRPLQPELVKDFESTPGLKVVRGPEYGSSSLWVNTERKGLDRKEVRQAINFAIDSKKIIETVYLGFATPGAAGYVHPENPFFNKDVKTEFSVAKANQLLDGIGAARGSDGTRVLAGTPLKYEIIVDQTGGPLRVRQAELVSQMLKDVGITTTVKVLERNAYIALAWPEFDVRKGRNYDMAMAGWSAPTQFEAGRLVEQVHSDPLVGSLNLYGFKDPAGDKLAEQLRDEGDPEKRIALAKQMQAYFAEQQFIINVLYQDGLYAYKQTVFDGFKFQKGLGIFQKNSFIPGAK